MWFRCNCILNYSLIHIKFTEEGKWNTKGDSNLPKIVVTFSLCRRYSLNLINKISITKAITYSASIAQYGSSSEIENVIYNSQLRNINNLRFRIGDRITMIFITDTYNGNLVPQQTYTEQKKKVHTYFIQ